jgi:hypothetical protein
MSGGIVAVGGGHAEVARRTGLARSGTILVNAARSCRIGKRHRKVGNRSVRRCKIGRDITCNRHVGAEVGRSQIWLDISRVWRVGTEVGRSLIGRSLIGRNRHVVTAVGRVGLGNAVRNCGIAGVRDRGVGRNCRALAIGIASIGSRV